MRPPCQIAFPANFVYAGQGGQKAPQNICFACSEKRRVTLKHSVDGKDVRTPSPRELGVCRADDGGDGARDAASLE